MIRFWLAYRIPFVVATGVIVLDQICKAWVRATLWLTQTWMPFDWLEPYVRIVNWKNTGGSFGILEEDGRLFILLALVAVCLILFYYPRVPRNDWSLRWSLAFLLGGISSNLIDRLHQGYVTDFISIGPIYVFNLADLSNLVGVLVLLIGIGVDEWRKHMIKVEVSSGDPPATV